MNNSDPSGMCVNFFNIVCVGSGSVTSTVSFRFDPGAGANAIVNIGRGASFGLSDKIANWISPGASCTVPQNGIDYGIGATGITVATLGGGSAAEGGVAGADAGINATAHGAEQLAARGFSTEDIAATLQGEEFTQADGATVYLAETTPGKFNVIVMGDRGVVTALKGIGEGAVGRLAQNYGWSG